MNTLKIKDSPIIDQLSALEEIEWINPNYNTSAKDISGLTFSDIEDAEQRLKRFASFFKVVFEDTQKTDGIIESALIPIPTFNTSYYNNDLRGQLFLKGDHALPVAGSIKARGGIYEVIKHAESLAIEAGLLSLEHDYSKLASLEFKKFFGQFGVTVGSTGNLGLSIGIISAQLGFHVTVHMSSDAKSWKKSLLRSKGVHVVEHNTDYSLAVEQGRLEASKDPNNYFIDDENSSNLFLGYSVAGLRLKAQLESEGIIVDNEHPFSFIFLVG